MLGILFRMPAILLVHAAVTPVRALMRRGLGLVCAVPALEHAGCPYVRVVRGKEVDCPVGVSGRVRPRALPVLLDMLLRRPSPRLVPPLSVLSPNLDRHDSLSRKVNLFELPDLRCD